MKAGNRSKSKGGGYVEDCFPTCGVAAEAPIGTESDRRNRRRLKISSLTKRTVALSLLGIIACSYAIAAGHYSWLVAKSIGYEQWQRLCQLSSEAYFKAVPS